MMPMTARCGAAAPCRGDAWWEAAGCVELTERVQLQPHAKLVAIQTEACPAVRSTQPANALHALLCTIHTVSCWKRAADTRYITSSEDGNRGDVICTVEQVKELIARKAAAEDGIAAIWLTTAEMGFSLTEEQDEVVCAKDVKAGRITDRFLAPAISRFATDVWSMSKQTAGVRKKVEDLHQRWGKTNHPGDRELGTHEQC